MKILELKPLSKPVDAKVKIPGSKSYTNRALLIAALSGSTVKISNPLFCDDTRAMVLCLKTLGIQITQQQTCLTVCSILKLLKDKTYNLDADLSGTTIRFILALSTVVPGIKILNGKEGLNKRPVAELVDGLIRLGAKIEYLDKQGFPPIKVLSSQLKNNTVKIKGSVSSQYISALLMIGPVIGGLSIEVYGKQVSRPYIDMTIDIMAHFGVKVINENYRKYIVSPGQRYSAAEYKVEGDLSSAGYFLAIAALNKSKIAIKNVNPNSKQADMGFLKILEGMGNKISFGNNEVFMTGAGVKAVNVNMQDCPDQIQTMAVLAAFARGTSKISGISTLRIKETDRVFALRQELKKMGIKTSATKDILTIHGGSPKATTIEVYGDHRMAMSFAIAGAILPGMRISDPDVVGKTFPGFFEILNSIGVKSKVISSKNIVLIGMRGSGKTTVAKLLAKRLNKKYLEMDDMVVKKVGIAIPELVKKYGWDFFREKEREVAQQAALNSDTVISTGGGVVINPKNIHTLKRNGVFVFLDASVNTLLQRIGNGLDRPFLTSAKTRKQEIKELLAARGLLYKRAADMIIKTDNLNPEEVTDRVISKLK